MVNRYLTLALLLSAFVCSTVMAQDISDVSSSHGDYRSIKKSIDQGYLSVFSDHSFKPDRAVTRREIALILEDILGKVDEKKVTLTASEIKELNALSKSFKSMYADMANQLSEQAAKNETVAKDQALIHADVSQLHERVAELEKQLADTQQDMKKSQKRYNLILGVVAVLGVMLGG